MAHSHDGIDWDAKVARLREGDELAAPETADLVRDLLRPQDRTVIDVGAGAGGAATAFADAMWDTGGTIVLVDSAPELLAEARRNTTATAGPDVRVLSVQADVSRGDLSAVGQADLVFASFVVHHLPDQLAGLRRLVKLIRPGGRLALVESGLEPRVLPWDVGLGEPGLESRLAAAHAEWFREMRDGMPGSVRLRRGWAQAMAEAGLDDVLTWTQLVDRPAPVSGAAMTAVLRRLERLRRDAEGRVAQADLDAVDALLDPGGEHYAGNRDDVFYLHAQTIHVGTRRG
ncbi:class I SAM-dependent methyltransferase [Saccharopolyspora sp. MS10]|uniref:class I SAM-dependent methyltransferase n=1 Tax=Saccharopolyspora sp. MS10 TaxID=3385973 RepID=UPI0039A2E84F